MVKFGDYTAVKTEKLFMNLNSPLGVCEVNMEETIDQLLDRLNQEEMDLHAEVERRKEE